MVDVTH